jgi:hypothetical protein
MIKRLIIIGLIVCQSVAGCASSTSAENAELMTGAVDTFSFTLRRKSFTTNKSSDKQFDQQVDSIMNKFGYRDYRILDVVADPIAAKDTYVVQFYK